MQKIMLFALVTHLFLRFIYLSDRKRKRDRESTQVSRAAGRGRGRSRFPAEQGA